MPNLDDFQRAEETLAAYQTNIDKMLESDELGYFERIKLETLNKRIGQAIRTSAEYRKFKSTRKRPELVA